MLDAFDRHVDVRNELLAACPACGAEAPTDELRSAALDGYGLSRCRACDLVFTNPRPIAEDIPKLYEGRAAGMDLATDSSLSLAMKSLKINAYVRKLLSLAGIAGEFTALDAGCGDGMIARGFAAMPRCTGAAGVDFEADAPPLLDAPKMTYRSYDRMAELGTFDIIVLRHVLEHVTDTNAFLDIFLPRLSQRGRLFIEVPDYRSTWRRLFGASYNQLVIPYHLYHFTPETLARTVKSFTIAKVVGVNVPVIAPSLGRAIGRRVSHIGPMAALLYPPQIVIDTLTGNHTAMLAVAQAK